MKYFLLPCSYIYEPSVGVDGRKPDSPGSSLYQPHHLPAHTPLPPPPAGGERGGQKHGFHNLGYSKSSDSTLMLEADNNQVNQRLHAAPSAREPRPAPPASVYIIQPEPAGGRWVQDRSPSQVPVYPGTLPYQSPAHYHQRQRWESPLGECANGLSSSDELDEGVGGTPEYPCDTGDEGSVLSADVHTSSTSLSSADTKDELRGGGRRPRRNPDATSTVESGISVMKSEDEEDEGTEVGEEGEEGTHSITDSMVAEALAALEAATAGEECE